MTGDKDGQRPHLRKEPHLVDTYHNAINLPDHAALQLSIEDFLAIGLKKGGRVERLGCVGWGKEAQGNTHSLALEWFPH